MSMPGFAAEASVYKTNNHYRLTTGGSFRSDGNTNVVPQGCGWVKGSLCGVVIVGGAAACTVACLAPGGQAGCYFCWVGFLGASFAFCKDCIPDWMRAIIDAFEGGGGGDGGGGGGGGGVPKKCCEWDETRPGHCILWVPKGGECP